MHALCQLASKITTAALLTLNGLRRITGKQPGTLSVTESGSVLEPDSLACDESHRPSLLGKPKEYGGRARRSPLCRHVDLKTHTKSLALSEAGCQQAH